MRGGLPPSRVGTAAIAYTGMSQPGRSVVLHLRSLSAVKASHSDLDALAGRAWAPFQVYVLNPDWSCEARQRVKGAVRMPCVKSSSRIARRSR